MSIATPDEKAMRLALAQAEQAYQAGADLFMGKPLEEEAFILAIKKLLKIPS